MKLILILFPLITVVGTLLAVAISLSDEVFCFDKVLCTWKEFIRCIFMFQFAVHELLSDDINTAGMIIIQIIVSICFFYLNIIIFLILIAGLLVKALCIAFYNIFRKER